MFCKLNWFSKLNMYYFILWAINSEYLDFLTRKWWFCNSYGCIFTKENLLNPRLGHVFSQVRGQQSQTNIYMPHCVFSKKGEWTKTKFFAMSEVCYALNKYFKEYVKTKVEIILATTKQTLHIPLFKVHRSKGSALLNVYV